MILLLFLARISKCYTMQMLCYSTGTQCQFFESMEESMSGISDAYGISIKYTSTHSEAEMYSKADADYVAIWAYSLDTVDLSKFKSIDLFLIMNLKGTVFDYQRKILSEEEKLHEMKKIIKYLYENNTMKASKHTQKYVGTSMSFSSLLSLSTPMTVTGASSASKFGVLSFAYCTLDIEGTLNTNYLLLTCCKVSSSNTGKVSCDLVGMFAENANYLSRLGPFKDLEIYPYITAYIRKISLSPTRFYFSIYVSTSSPEFSIPKSMYTGSLSFITFNFDFTIELYTTYSQGVEIWGLNITMGPEAPSTSTSPSALSAPTVTFDNESNWDAVTFKSSFIFVLPDSNTLQINNAPANADIQVSEYVPYGIGGNSIPANAGLIFGIIILIITVGCIIAACVYLYLEKKQNTVEAESANHEEENQNTTNTVPPSEVEVDPINEV